MTQSFIRLSWTSVINRHFFVLSSLYLVLLTFLVHGNALSGWWRWDDPEHLIYLVEFSPWQFFFDRDAWQSISPVNFTPLLSFSLYIDLQLFGVEPFGFYAHHLLSLCAAAIMSLLLFQLWLPGRWSLLAVTLFLLGTSTFVVAQQLMSRHYVEGLALFIAALYCFVSAVRSNRAGYAWLGGLCYLLAMLCKEIYAPLIALLPFLLEGSWQQRCRRGIPFLLAALFYICWRLFMLDAPVSGYSSWQAFDVVRCLKQFAGIPQLLLGKGWLSSAAFFSLLGICVAALGRRPAGIWLMLVSAGLLLLPLAPLTTRPGLSYSDSLQLERFLFLPWWSVCLMAAWSFSMFSTVKPIWRVLKSALLFIIFCATLSHLWGARVILRQEIDWQEIHGRFVWEAEENNAMLLPPDIPLRYCKLLSELRQSFGGGPPLIVLDEIHLDTLDLGRVAVNAFSPACACIDDISEQIPGLLQIWRDSLIDRPFEIEGRRGYRFFSWRLGPYTDGQYSFISNVMGKEKMPHAGEYQAVFDVNPGIIVVRYDAPDGSVSYSKPFRISADGIGWLPEYVVKPER